MNRIELNERPAKDTEIVKLASVLDCSTDFLLGRTEDPHSKIKMENEGAEFEAFKNDPELNVFYKELPQSDAEAVRKLRDIWEIIKKEG